MLSISFDFNIIKEHKLQFKILGLFVRTIGVNLILFL